MYVSLFLLGPTLVTSINKILPSVVEVGEPRGSPDYVALFQEIFPRMTLAIALGIAADYRFVDA